MRLIPIECVRENSVLGKSIYNDSGEVLLKKGVKLTKSLLDIISNQHIFSIYIEDSYSAYEIEDVIKPEIRNKFISVVRETFNEIREHKAYNNIYDINNIAEELINSVLSNKDTLINLVDIKSLDNYTYRHSVNVAVISIVIGLSLEFTNEELLELTLGALMHDIGKAFINKDNEPMYHTKAGYDYLIKNFDYSASVIKAVVEHHERVDGTGYPKGLKGNEISINARIIAIADVYDKLTSDRPKYRAIPINDAVEFIMAHVGTIFDYKLVKKFTQIIIAYPKGTIVKLSTGEISIVIDSVINYPLRPLVKIIKSSISSNIGTVINLMEELSITIINVEYYV